jgi:hypothetical protein
MIYHGYTMDIPWIYPFSGPTHLSKPAMKNRHVTTGRPGLDGLDPTKGEEAQRFIATKLLSASGVRVVVWG